MRRKPVPTGFAPRIAYVRTSMTSGIEQSAKEMDEDGEPAHKLRIR